MKNCLKNNFNIKYNDPYIQEIELNGKKIKSDTIPNKNNSIDLAILTTDHDCYDYKKILKSFKAIIDTRGKYYKLKDKKIIHA
jgi:UDP-N-acetyl-D-glucosamine dehydrogenase